MNNKPSLSIFFDISYKLIIAVSILLIVNGLSTFILDSSRLTRENNSLVEKQIILIQENKRLAEIQVDQISKQVQLIEKNKILTEKQIDLLKELLELKKADHR